MAYTGPGTQLPDIRWDSSGNDVTFSDERQRSAVDLPAGVVGSITLERNGGDNQWGEFITRAQARALVAWLGLLLA